MSRGPRSTPPELPGFTPDRWIGGGGFADVFLYTQMRPSRSVAIKILRKEHLSAQALSNFDAEADIMAEVSTHPYIVTIFASGVSPDGRPYIVMEHYPQPNFGERARGGALDVTEILRTGIQVCAAIETAHRAGIVHRDIKPANILTSAFGRPGLTDFGISGVQKEGAVTEAIGITVAYTAPELINEESAGSVATDVYGLGATISALAAGHSPFWSPSGDNGDQAVLARAIAGQITPINRPDIPKSLNLLLAQAMAANPAHRPTSALALAQSLQQIEQELRLQPTPIEVAPTDDDRRHIKDRKDNPDDAERTRRSIQVVNPHAPTSPSTTGPPSAKVPPATRPAAPKVPEAPIIPSAAPSSTSFAPPSTPPSIAPPSSTPGAVPSSMPGAAAPRTTRVPTFTTTPSWERSAPPAPPTVDEAETVARAKTPSAFAPPPSPTFIPPSTSAPTPYAPPVTAPADALTGDAPATPARRQLPWKPIAAVVGLLVAVAIVSVIASTGSRNAKDAPGDGTAASGGVIQSMPSDNNTSTPVQTPTDLKITSFFPDANGNEIAIITWTQPADTATNLTFQVVPFNGGKPTSVTFPAHTNAGTLTVSIPMKLGTCQAVVLGSKQLPKTFCTGGPPCFSATATKTGAASGDAVSIQMDTDTSPAPTSTLISPMNYNQACTIAFAHSN